MKNKGALAEFAEERAKDLYSAYKEYIENCSLINVKEAYSSIVEKPARRFYVSGIRASVVMSAIERGKKPLENMLPLKREMYEEIYQRVVAMKKTNPEYDLCLCCFLVVEQTAPKYYISGEAAYAIVCKARKRWKKELRKRVLR